MCMNPDGGVGVSRESPGSRPCVNRPPRMGRGQSPGDGRNRRQTRMLGNLACVLLMATSTAAAMPMAEGNLEPGKPATVLTVPATEQARTLAVVVALKRPGALTPAEPVTASVEVGEVTLNK